MALDGEMDGLIANNTTISREGLKTPKNQIDAIGAGGLSGAPLRQKSDEVLAYLSQKLKGKTTLIACGGINSVADAQRKIDLGADLVQIYTGFIYQGPALIRDIGAKLYKKKA
jgi:dihydroorotate dehydrogenase